MLDTIKKAVSGDNRSTSERLSDKIHAARARLAVAKADLAETLYLDIEKDIGAPAAVQEARQSVSKAEQELNGLEAANRIAVQKEQAAIEKRRRDEIQAVKEKASALVLARHRAALDVEKHVEALAESLNRVVLAGEEFRNLAKSFSIDVSDLAGAPQMTYRRYILEAYERHLSNVTVGNEPLKFLHPFLRQGETFSQRIDQFDGYLLKQINDAVSK